MTEHPQPAVQFEDYHEHPDPHFLLDLSGRILAINAACQGETAIVGNNLVGALLAELVTVTPANSDGTGARVLSPASLDELLALVNAGGTRRFWGSVASIESPVEFTMSPARSRGLIVGVLVAARPMSATVRQAPSVQAPVAANAEWLAALETMFQAYPTPLIVRTVDDIIERWNAAAAELYGWPASATVGKSLASILYPEPNGYASARETLLADGVFSGEIEYRARDGRSVHVEAHWTLVHDSQGNPSRILSRGLDITSTKAERDQHDRNSRFESLGTLAGGIAHDLNNALTPILLSAQLLLRTENDEKSVRLLRSIESSAIHGANLIKRVLQFARGVESKNYVLDVGTLIRSVDATIRENLRPGVSIEIEIEERLLPVLADSTQLRQVVMNLINNAQDSMPGGGRIAIRAYGRLHESDEERLTAVVIEVEDAGTGIPEDNLGKIFDPFFTTKAVGDGTGLGLSTSLTIATGLRGTIQVANNAAVGATFSLILPAASGMYSLADAATDSPQPSSLVTPAPGAERLILVVDDDPEILEITCRILENSGYATASARNGQEAISYIESGATLDVVLADITMPMLDGIALSRFVRTTRPETRIITMSGKYRPSAAAPSLAGVPHLVKPFSTDQLLESMSTILNSGSTHA